MLDEQAVRGTGRVPEKSRDPLVRESRLDEATVERLLEQAAVMSEMEDHYSAHDGIDLSTVTFGVQTAEGRKTVSAYGMSLRGDGSGSQSLGREQHHETLDQLRALYRSVMEELSPDAGPARTHAVVVLTRPFTPGEVDLRGLPSQEWPSGLTGYLSGADAARAAELSPPGRADFFLLDGDPHVVQVMPVIPYIPPSVSNASTRQILGLPGRGVPHHPSALAYPIIDTTYGGRVGAEFRFEDVGEEEVADWYRAEMPERGWELAKEEDSLQVWLHPEREYHYPIVHVRILPERYVLEDVHIERPETMGVPRHPDAIWKPCEDDGDSCWLLPGMRVEEARGWYAEYLGYLEWTQVEGDLFSKDDGPGGGPSVLRLEYEESVEGALVRVFGERG